MLWRSSRWQQRFALSLGVAGLLILVVFEVQPDYTGAEVGATMCGGALIVVAFSLLFPPVNRRVPWLRSLLLVGVTGSCLGIASMWANAFWPAQVGVGLTGLACVWAACILAVSHLQRRKPAP